MSHDETPILLNGQVPDEPVRLLNGDTVVLVNPAVAGKIVVGPLRILGPNGYQAAHIGTEPPGALPDGAPEDWYFTHGAIARFGGRPRSTRNRWSGLLLGFEGTHRSNGYALG